MTPLLRPLSFSEMLDRAFGLSVRTALPVAAVMALMFGISFGGGWTILFVATRVHAPGVMGLILAVLFFFATSVAGQGAALTGLVDAYFGRPVQFSRMLTGSRHVWAQLCLLSLFYLALFALVGVVAVTLYFGGVWLGGHVQFVGILLGILIACMVLALYGFAFCAAYVAVVGCVAEWRPAVESFERGWKRAAGGGRAGRTLGYGLLITFGGLAVALAFQLMGLGLAALCPQGTVLAGVVAGAPAFLANIFYFIFELAWFVVYYVDLRIRTEGLDLTLQSELLGPIRGVAPAEA